MFQVQDCLAYISRRVEDGVDGRLIQRLGRSPSQLSDGRLGLNVKHDTDQIPGKPKQGTFEQAKLLTNGTPRNSFTPWVPFAIWPRSLPLDVVMTSVLAGESTDETKKPAAATAIAN